MKTARVTSTLRLQPATVPYRALGAAASASLLSACGGGGGGSGLEPQPSSAAQRAARTLGQATFGATHATIERVQAEGLEAWIERQFALPRGERHVDWLFARGWHTVPPPGGQSMQGLNASLWRQFIRAEDQLRQRVAYALSQILVASSLGIANGWRAFALAYYMDILLDGAFGNYRALLEQVTTSPAMGIYLTYRGNRKADAETGRVPDENYARELMQLFTIGLYQLNADGTLKLNAGLPVETYTQDDIAGLARVFTGWVLDQNAPARGAQSALAQTVESTRTRAASQSALENASALTRAGERASSRAANTDLLPMLIQPMVMLAGAHEPGEKRFLGTTIAAGTDGVASMHAALDALMAHPNTAPFVGRQLIQRLVCSNPSPAYVARVAAVFNRSGNSGGRGEKGDLKAVVRAILLDQEAQAAPTASSGKLREPVLRFTQWARAFAASSPSDEWRLPDMSEPGARLAQSPLAAPSVFNFYRPGYVPPGTAIVAQKLVAPEFQITNESSVAGYVNFMQHVLGAPSVLGSDVAADYSAWLKWADTPAVLLEQLNLVLAAGQVSPATLEKIRRALETLPAQREAGRRNRVRCAILLMMTAPEYLVQK